MNYLNTIKLSSMILQAIRCKARWTRWTKTEDNAMKEKTSLAIMDTLYKIYEVPIKIPLKISYKF